MVEWALEQPGMENVGSLNAVVGETNDGGLNDIRNRPITPAHVREAIESASGGPVEEGSVGAGTGTRALGWKGGIGTASRRLPESAGGHTIGVLVRILNGKLDPIAFDDILDPVTHKTRVRMVDTKSYKYEVARRHMIRIRSVHLPRVGHHHRLIPARLRILQ